MSDFHDCSRDIGELLMTIKAILWDFGGVLTSSPFEAFNAYEKAHGIPKDFIRKVNSKNHLDNAWARFESNQIDMEQFDRQFLEETTQGGFSIRGQDVTDLLGGDLRPRMITILKQYQLLIKKKRLFL